MNMSLKKIKEKRVAGFSLAEALITLLIICVIAIASAPVLTKKHRARMNIPHGVFACYWQDNQLVSKYVINGKESNGKTIYDNEEGRYGCEFNPPTGAKNFVATIVGGGGGGAGAGLFRTGNKKIYTDVGEHIYTTETGGLYKIFAVGAGGGGGEGTSNKHAGDPATSGLEYNGKLRAGMGSTGAISYLPGIFIAKNTVLNIKVGAGGNVGWTGDSLPFAGVGSTGGDSFVKDVNKNINYATAGGGGGGYSATDSWPCRLATYNSSGTSVEIIERDAAQGRCVAAPYAYSGLAGKASSDFGNALLYDGKRAEDSDKSYTEKYVLTPKLTDFNSVIGIEFNKVTVNKKNNALLCNRKDGFGVCKDYANIFGAGGGGNGSTRVMQISSAAGYAVDYPPTNGSNGLVVIVYSPVFAGLGGKAGKVIQIPYASLPEKTLLFPGKGGKGGVYVDNITAANNAPTAGSDGEPSYIKNGTHILGGSGAAKIVPNSESTYSSEVNSENLPVGQNGALSDVLTSKKVGSGGLGGLNGDNASINGLTQVVFRNNDISDFKNIYGAGSGGGEATVSINASESIEAGTGGDGTSGLVFIQW